MCEVHVKALKSYSAVYYKEGEKWKDRFFPEISVQKVEIITYSFCNITIYIRRLELISNICWDFSGLDTYYVTYGLEGIA